MTTSPGIPDVPKKIGVLIVGLGGNNGVTLLAGCLVNKQNLEWESASAGRVSAPNWNGCVTQLEPRGGGVGFKGRFPLSDFTNAAVGGWDIRPTPLGDALYSSRVLDYDLVRQVRDDMNQFPIMKGVYDASFLGESQYETATHIVTDCPTFLDRVNHIRSDIRQFIKEHQVDGHTTVIWSASVERPADVDFKSADELLQAVLDNSADCDISPSILYAVAAGLEGCSFVNGGSQNTLSEGMSELYECTYRDGDSSVLKEFDVVSKDPAYLLGTDFKAGMCSPFLILVPSLSRQILSPSFDAVSGRPNQVQDCSCGIYPSTRVDS